MKRAGRVVTRENLIESVWGFDSEVRSNTLDAFIRLLRDKVDTAWRNEADPDGAGRGLLLAGGGSMRAAARKLVHRCAPHAVVFAGASGGAHAVRRRNLGRGGRIA